MSKLSLLALVLTAGVLFSACLPKKDQTMMVNDQAQPGQEELGEVMGDPQELAMQEQTEKQVDQQLMNLTKNVYELEEQNGSGQSGRATFMRTEDNKVKVVLEMTGGNFTGPQPAHVHVGNCPTPGAVSYPLTNVVSGMSETTLDVDMDTLLASSNTLSVNVHKSPTETSVYTACGDIQ